MIEYETINSPFYEINKQFCLQFERDLTDMHLMVNGYCNAFGFEIEASGIYFNRQIFIRCAKKQNMRNGIIWPLNAIDCIATEIAIDGTNEWISFTLTKSKLKRLFMNKGLKAIIPPPFYLHTSANISPQSLKSIHQLMVQFHIRRIRFINNQWVLEIEDIVADIKGLLRQLTPLI